MNRNLTCSSPKAKNHFNYPIPSFYSGFFLSESDEIRHSEIVSG